MRVFGYGSLVNRGTHAHSPAERLTVRGWRRVWRHTGLRPVPFLTVEPAQGVEIDGLAFPVAEAERPALLERESAYGTEVLPDGLTLFVIPVGRHPATEALHPIRLSYLDTVVAGYLAEFGVEGVARFFETTLGWDAPVADDRAAPLYPRAPVLTEEVRGLTDGYLERLGAARLSV